MDRRRPLFELGQVVATPGAIKLMEKYDVYPMIILRRHVTGDWGDLDDDDKRTNDEALVSNNRIFSAYQLGKTKDSRIWVITEWDRSVTTFLRPDEY